MSGTVIIAGAGPVGLALAVGLAHHGVGSVVLEESPTLSEHSGRGALLGARAPDATLTADTARFRLHDLVARDATLLLVDDGRRPGWNVADVEAGLGGIGGVRVVRIVKSATATRREDLIDVDGTVWREWAPRGAAAALVRPDAHVGWMAERPTAAELRAGVARALGA